MHHDIKTKKGIMNIDFVLKQGDEPRFVIECTMTQSIGKKFSYNLKRRIYEIDYRFTKLKATYPNVRTILALSVFEDALVKHRVRKIVENETIAIDDTFINNEIVALPKYIKETWQNKN